MREPLAFSSAQKKLKKGGRMVTSVEEVVEHLRGLIRKLDGYRTRCPDNATLHVGVQMKISDVVEALDLSSEELSVIEMQALSST